MVGHDEDFGDEITPGPASLVSVRALVSRLVIQNMESDPLHEFGRTIHQKGDPWVPLSLCRQLLAVDAHADLSSGSERRPPPSS